jgi:sulfite dehydrogenase (cytochrome) subunit B
MKKLFLVLTLFTLVALIARAGDRGWKLPPETTKLERGPGVELATAQCLLCHSADYISIQPPMTRAAWSATVVKMKEKYGAPILPDSTNALVNYLVKTYGTEKSAPDTKQ